MFIFQRSLPLGPHTSSNGVAVLLSHCYRNFHPDPQKSPEQQIWPHHQSDIASQPNVFSCLETEKSRMAPNPENMGDD